MKKIYINSIWMGLSVLLSACLTFNANAQQNDNPPQQRNSPPQQRSDNPPPQRSNPPQQRNDNPPQQRNAPSQQQQRTFQQQQPQRNDNQQRGNNVNIAPQQRTNPNNTAVVPQQRGNSYNGYNNGQQRGNNVNIAPQRQFSQGQRGYYNQNRAGVAPGYRGYRSYPGLAYGRNHITARPNGIYYNYRGYYRSYYAPQLGFRLSVLPFGYYPFYFGPNQFFYSGGLYYQLQDSQYTVVEPPVGASINTLPDKAQSIVIDGIQYYELNGVYYQPITKDDGTTVYQIAGKDGELNTEDPNAMQDALPQIGELMPTLPQEYKTLKLNGQKYYVTPDGYYLQDATDANGNQVYKIVGTPTEEPGN